MRINQIIPSYRYWHDISDIVLALQKTIQEIGFESDILTEEESRHAKKENAFYHMSLGSRPAKALSHLKLRNKFLFYHGLAPPEFFPGHEAQAGLMEGPRVLKELKNHFTFAYTITNYLEKELLEAGYKRTAVLPAPLDLRNYNRRPDVKLLKRYNDGYTNIISVGQITPNKKLEDTISIFNYYHKRINPRSRLFLVGGFSACPGYCQKLLALINELDIDNVIFTGRVAFKQLLAYYRLSRAFLMMSEYEGFSLPLIEAMHMEVPVVALNRAAVPEILGGAGCLMDDNDIQAAARLLDWIVNDRGKREEIISRQLKRVTGLMPEKVFPTYRMAIEELNRFEPPVSILINRKGLRRGETESCDSLRREGYAPQGRNRE